jgi:hypothetical protein
MLVIYEIYQYTYVYVSHMRARELRQGALGIIYRHTIYRVCVCVYVCVCSVCVCVCVYIYIVYIDIYRNRIYRYIYDI